MKLLVTGCGRSGTQYASAVFKAVGLDVGHESVGKNGTVDWHRVNDGEAFDVIFHQVRNPLHTIGSLTRGIRTASWRFICKTEPRVRYDAPIVQRAMQYWCYWNERAEALASETYRVESMIDWLAGRLALVGVDAGKVDMAAARLVPTNMHTRKGKESKTLEFKDLEEADAELAPSVRLMAERYGYSV